MKTHTYINNLYKTVVALLLTTVFNACVDDDWGRGCTPGTGDIKITLTLQLPGTPATRAMPADETTISQIQVLLFKPSGGPLVGSYPGTGITVDPGEPGKRNFTVDIIEGSFDLMVLANSKDIIDAADLARDMSRQEAAKRLQLSQTGKIAHNANTLIPFWGELNGAVITENATLDDISMLRALVKIDFLLSEAAKDKFELRTVTLYHWQENMALLPEHYDSASKKVTAATRTGSGLYPATGKTTYTVTDGEIVNDTIRSKIYLNETPNPGEDDFPVMPCLVIGGENNGEMRYYRVDFFRLNENDERTYHDLLRNHWYELTVNDIIGDGHPNEDEAYESKDNQIEINITEWDNGEMGDVSPDGNHQLKVNKATFNFDREERDQDSFNNELEIYTNHEDGWEITSVTDPDNNDADISMDDGWLQIIPAHRKGPKETTKIKLLLEKNEGNNTRRAEIRLQVGRLLDFVVKVIQGTETELELFIEDAGGNPLGELFYPEYYGWDDEHKSTDIRVRWSPKGGAYYCDVDVDINGDALFEFDDQGDKVTPGKLSDPEGSHTYNIAAKAFTPEEVSEKEGNPFLYRGTRVTFTVTDEQDPTKKITKVLYLRHQHYAIISKSIQKDSRLGKSYKFDVLSNTTWILERVENDGITTGPLPTPGTKGGNDIQKGDSLEYTLQTPVAGTIPGRGQAGRKLKFVFKDQQEIIPGEVAMTVTASYNDPNSYMLNPAGNAAQRTVDIPIRKLFWVWDVYAEQPLGTLTNADIEVGVVWSQMHLNSNLNGPSQPYNIQTELIEDNNILESILRVTIPASTTLSGNAVVGVKPKGAADDKWLYSWHLWLTGYNPASGANEDQFLLGTSVRQFTLMSRNIGALEYKNDVIGASVNGLFYQWGRKDPLHSSFASGSSPMVNTANNLGNALNNPRVFYRSTTGLEDWFTNRDDKRYQNHYLWNTPSNEKGVFDPCPEGWKIPGPDWGSAVHEFTVNRFTSRNIITDNSGRYISKEIAGVGVNDYCIFSFSGVIKSNGQWTLHPDDSNSEPAALVGLHSSTVDYFSQGNSFKIFVSGFQANENSPRACATPIRCVQEK
ncbi:MAG: hypothetical protein LUG98_10575 [Tannerellaceae bacterium]|nr:hypothetical protein [Tannerellaceae bacterium]